MKGFFPDIKQANTSKRPGRLDCYYCGLYLKCRSPKMKPTGEGKKGILVIAEAPGGEEDRLGIQLIGPAGQTLRKSLERVGIDLDRDCVKINAVNCRPIDDKGNNRTPTSKEIDCCRQRVWAVIKELKPKLIILLGNESCQSIYGHRWKKEFPGIMALRGWSIPDRELKCWVCPTFHPSFVMRSDKRPTVLQTFEQDLKNIVKTLNKPFPNLEDEKKLITILKDPEKVNSILKSFILDPPFLLYTDYEASGLKLHANGHFIKCVSFCWNDNNEIEHCIAFPYSEAIKPLLLRVLESKNIRKGAHNFSYEENCTRAFFKTSIQNMHFDTALAAHILDNRSKIVSLKFQVFVNFGVIDYASHLDEYILTPDKKSKNSFNRINEAPLDDLLIYNGLDSLYGKRLAEIQMKKLPMFLKGYGYDLFHEGMKTLVDMEDEGMCLDVDYCKEQHDIATKEIERMKNELFQFKEVLDWKKKEGAKFNINSDDQLKKVLFDDLKIKVMKRTKKGNIQADKNVLDTLSIQVPFVKKIVEMREMKTARDTYLKGWLREVVDGKIHTMFSLANVSSYRSGSSGPNLQNVPNRDEEKKKMLRRAVLPQPGCQILSADFRQIEVRVAACYTRDRALIEYCKDPTKDMHRDMAIELFMLPIDLVSKKVRHLSKNGFVFPEFYGDFFMQVATAMWEEMQKRNIMLADNSMSLKQHLHEMGMKDYQDFEDHVQKIEEKFWKVRFKEYDQWKWDTYNGYLRKGYIDSLTGFRYTGPLERKHICNYPIQGCLIGSSKILTEDGLINICKLVDKKIKVWTGFKWANAVAVKMGEWQTAEIKLSSGLVIKCDTRHKIKNELNEWVDFKNIKVGDFVSLPVLDEETKPSKSVTWSFVFGFIVGDGHLYLRTKNNKTRKGLQITVGKTKKEILINIQQFLTNKGFKTNFREIHPNDGVRDVKYYLGIERKSFSFFLEEKGFIFGTTAHTKTIPESIWTSSKQEIRDFLEGVWLSDGARIPSKDLHMCNKNLLEEVQILSSCVGFDSLLRKTKNGWKISFNKRAKNAKPTRKIPRSTIEKALEGATNKKKYKHTCNIITEDRALRSGKAITQYVAERILKRKNPKFEIYRYDTVENIKTFDKKEQTYTMVVDDCLHQFVANGIITKNSAFHCLLWTITRLNEIRKQEKLKSKLILQIHDEQVWNLHSGEKNVVSDLIQHVCTKELPEHFKWIIVPMGVDMEIADVNQSWYYKKLLEA